eukprot:3274028-Rhodomonas_salina.1
MGLRVCTQLRREMPKSTPEVLLAVRQIRRILSVEEVLHDRDHPDDQHDAWWNEKQAHHHGRDRQHGRDMLTWDPSVAVVFQCRHSFPPEEVAALLA